MSPREQLLSILEQLELPSNQFVVFGGGVLAVRDIRQIGDVDIFVKKALYNKLSKEGWIEKRPHPHDPPFLEKYVDDKKINVFYDWTSRKWEPGLKRFLKYPEIIEGYPFVPLEAMYEWKTRLEYQRKKDIRDIRLIEQHANALT